MQHWFKRVPGFASHSDIYVHTILDAGTESAIHSNSRSKSCIIYFGGDVQNAEEFMLSNSENSIWRNFSLEQTASLLYKKFSSNEENQKLSHQNKPIIMAISPQDFSAGSYSHFSQFVDSADFTGSPIYSSVGWRAWSELEALAENALRLTSTPSDSGSTNGSPPTVQFTLIGFSKGCVVLNELLLELARVNLACRAPARAHGSKNAVVQRVARFASCVQHWVWLDGGHNGLAPVWIQDAAVVNALTELPLEHSAATAASTSAPVYVHVAVSPYQTSDSRRPHIGRQCARFCELLRDRQAAASCAQHTRPLRVTFELLFESDPRSLQAHFGVLEAFSINPNGDGSDSDSRSKLS